MIFHNIKFEVEAGIAILTLSRPDNLNSFNSEMHVEVREVLDAIQNDETIRVLVLTGEGRAFSAGQDLMDPCVVVEEGKPLPDLGFVVESTYKPLIMRLTNLSVPTIAAVNGIAAGAGVSLALACDLVIASRSATFIQAFSKVGLIPDSGGTWFLPQRVGMARAIGLAFLGSRLSAEDACKWGLIWSVIDDEKFESHIQEEARKLSQMPTRALVRTRMSMHHAQSNNLEDQLSLEAREMQELGWGNDYLEGVTAFKQRRAPKFSGI